MTHTTATNNTTSDIGRYNNPNAVAADIVKLKLGNGQVIATAECIGTAPEFKCDVQTTDRDEAILSIDVSSNGNRDSDSGVRLSESHKRCRTRAAALAS